MQMFNVLPTAQVLRTVFQKIYSPVNSLSSIAARAQTVSNSSNCV